MSKLMDRDDIATLMKMMSKLDPDDAAVGMKILFKNTDEDSSKKIKNNKKVAEAGEKDKNHDQKKVKEQKQGGGGGGEGGKKEGNANPLLLKLYLHCEGCASEVAKIVKNFEGVENVEIDRSAGTCAVTGKVDPVKLRDKIEQKTHKKVELLSPVPKKAGDGKEEKDHKSKDKNSNEKDKKNAKQLPVTSAMLKISLNCERCNKKIREIVSKTKGYEEMKVDEKNDVVMVKGAMDMKALAETLKKNLEMDVKILQPKKMDLFGTIMYIAF